MESKTVIEGISFSLMLKTVLNREDKVVEIMSSMKLSRIVGP